MEKTEKVLDIDITTIELVKAFVRDVTYIPNDMDLTDGRHTVDAKSILGIFSLNIMRPLKLSVFVNNEEEFTTICRKLSKYIVED